MVSNELLKEEIKSVEADMISFRRLIHQHPETAFEEVETTNRIARKLDDFGITYKRMDPTGLVGEIEGNKPGKTILLRADIDALDVKEETGEEYASQTEGKMHACGHDNHASMLVAALKVLNQHKDDIEGTVRFVFQPAEEVGEGADAMIAQGAVDGVDYAFGLHVMPIAKTGQIIALKGKELASADFFYVDFIGKGGHGGMPQYSNDPIMMATHFVQSIQTILSRRINPLHPGVITVGSFNSGSAANVIPGEARLSGTVRTFDDETRDVIEKDLEEFANEAARLYGGEAIVKYDRLTNSIINDEAGADLVDALVLDAFGEEYVVKTDPSMGGEDFGSYLREVPGTFAMVGTQNDDLPTHFPNHHKCFNIDEDALKYGAFLHASFALNHLKNNA